MSKVKSEKLKSSAKGGLIQGGGILNQCRDSRRRFCSETSALNQGSGLSHYPQNQDRVGPMWSDEVIQVITYNFGHLGFWMTISSGGDGWVMSIVVLL